METLLHEIFTYLVGLLLTVITTTLLPFLVKYIQSKIRNQKLQQVTGELGETIISAVDYVNQTFVNQLKKDGKFDIDAQKEALSIAIDVAINNLTESTIDIINSEGVSLQKLLETKIEAYINGKKE